MGRFYGTKIKTGQIYSKTGLPWTIDDVPKYWKAATIQWLEENPD